MAFRPIQKESMVSLFPTNLPFLCYNKIKEVRKEICNLKMVIKWLIFFIKACSFLARAQTEYLRTSCLYKNITTCMYSCLDVLIQCYCINNPCHPYLSVLMNIVNNHLQEGLWNFTYFWLWTCIPGKHSCLCYHYFEVVSKYVLEIGKYFWGKQTSICSHGTHYDNILKV